MLTFTMTVRMPGNLIPRHFSFFGHAQLPMAITLPTSLGQRLMRILVMLLFCTCCYLPTFAQELLQPVITGYAGVASVSVDTTVIDSTATQRVVAELVSPAIKPDAPHQYLVMVARW